MGYSLAKNADGSHNWENATREVSMSDKQKEDTVLFTEEEIKEIESEKDRLMGGMDFTSQLMSPEELKAMMSEVQDMKGQIDSMMSEAQNLVRSIQPVIDKMDK